MASPRVSLSSQPVTEIDAEVVALLLSSPSEADAEMWPGLAEALTGLGFEGKRGQFVRVPLPGRERALAVVGTGAAPGTTALREAAGVAARSLTGVASIALAAPAAHDDSLVLAVLEGAGLGAYAFDSYKTSGARTRAGRVTVAASASASDALAARAQAVIDAVALTKDLATTPANHLWPAAFADRAIAELDELPIEVTVLHEHELQAQGFGGILGVGLGSERPPRYVRAAYAPAGATRHIAIVGKGITFDTGGLSLKPAASMVGMKYDMEGAASALAVVQAAARLELPINVTAHLCLAENMPSGRATRPGDVLTALDGTTIEVLNTDAEGRLVLADGLVAASREKPDLIIDVATLTGAVTVALGSRHAGVMGDDDAVRDYLAAAERAGELAWQLPLPEYMRDELDSPIADLQNAKIGDPAGGTLFAGLFLQHFIGRVSDAEGAPRIPWVHLDIANVGNNKGAPYGFVDKGTTGASVRSIVELIATMASA